MSFNPIPPRVAFVNQDGTLTREAILFFTQLFSRVGGANGLGNNDLAILSSFDIPPSVEKEAVPDIDPWAVIAELRKEVDDLRHELLVATAPTAEIGEIRRSLLSMAIECCFAPPQTDWEHPGKIGAKTTNTGAFTTISASGQITSTVATGTAPFVVASTTVVGNLNVSQLLGKTWAVPDPIGSGTPNTGAFTTLSATGTATFGVTGTAGLIQIRRASDGAVTGTDTMVANVRELDNAAGDILLRRGGTERFRATATGATVTGALSCTSNTLVTGSVTAFGAGAAAKQTVTGSRGGNAALASFLTAMATYGFITDSSTA